MANTELYRKAKRLIEKAEKKGYKFSDYDIGCFNALGRAEWDEEKYILSSFNTLTLYTGGFTRRSNSMNTRCT